MAHFDPTALCFLNRGDEIYEGNKQGDRHGDEHATCLYYTDGWKLKANKTQPIIPGDDIK